MTSEPDVSMVLPTDPASTAPLLRRLGANAAWLLGGRGVSGLISLAYLAIAARALGPTPFGVFSLVLSFGSALAALVDCQTGYAAIRFGAIHLVEEQPDRLRRLMGALAMLDLTAACVGIGIAILAVPFVASRLAWTPSQAHAALAFTVLLLASTGSTASGALRLFDRFDLLACAETVGPLIRLAGSIVLWRTHPSLDGFLAVWALALLGESLATWTAAFATRRLRLDLRPRSALAVWRENPRLGAFATHNNLASTVALVWQYAGIFMIGGMVGAAAAGGFRVASKLAKALGKPAESLTRALYPEFARLSAGQDAATVQAVMRKATAGALILGVALVALVAFLGADVLHVLYGHAFLFAAPVFLALTIATAIDLSGMALEPVLNAHGHSGRMLAAHCLGVAVQIGALVLFVPRFGTIGAGFAAILSALTLRAALSVMARSALRPATSRADRSATEALD